MADGLEALTEKEKQTLRLVGSGYDAKSLARHLEISVHTVNERLRHARRKMAVSSSREAARILIRDEGQATNFLAHKPMGDAADGRWVEQAKPSHDGQRTRPGYVQTIAGVSLMSLLLAAIALPSTWQAGPSADAARLAHDMQDEVHAGNSGPAESSAREWLVLVDRHFWTESWDRTSTAFKELNSRERWAEVSEQVRPPLGDVVSRVIAGEETVPAPPHGLRMVKFRTDFANRPGATETLTLAYEGGAWRIAGYIIS